MVKKRACVFISGSGTNLREIIRSSRDYSFPVNVCLVVSNNEKAKGNIFAKKFSIPFICINDSKYKFEKTILKKLFEYKIDIICLAGFMKILSKKFIRNFKGKIINIHPSLLPKYKGLNTFQKALKSNEKMTGCTVHFVNEKIDSGKIIIKKKVNIYNDDNVETLKKKVQFEEYRAFSSAIRKIYSLN
tara:strand:- start:654 stop:1217 length:564 start_codon:yes stop_codon:yes gene_type:complete